MSTSAGTPIGSFPVRAEADEVAAFRAAIGADGAGAELPFTYPIRWMVSADVRPKLLALVPEPDLVLFHESQTFAYERRLRSGEDYTLSLTARRETAPDRLLVDGTIVDAAGRTWATVETILRLFSTKALAA